MPLLSLALALLAQSATPELIDLEQGPPSTNLTTLARLRGTAAGKLWVSGRREAQTTQVWTLSAPGADPEPFYFGPFSSEVVKLQAVYDLGAGRSLLVTGNSFDPYLDLHVSDGTSAGTQPLEVRLANPNDPLFEITPQLKISGGTAYFVGQTPGTGDELFRSDGTVAGTSLVTDFTAGSQGTFFEALGATGTTLVFSLGTQIWPIPTVGGSAVQLLAGAVAVGTSFFFEPAGNRLVFPFTLDFPLGTELFATDGTTAGTGLLKEINAAPAPIFFGSKPELLAGDGTTAYF